MSSSARGAASRHDLSYNMDDAPHSSSGFERGFSGSDAEFDDRDIMTPVGMDLSENFKVAIRVRPPVPRELEGSRGFINVVRIPPDQQSITLCDVDAEDGRGNVYATQSYTFDNVYDQSARQRDVYDRSAHPAVQSVLQGYNATVMAYGQTGTGKTYTMEGFTNGEHRGIIPLATEEIFAFIESHRNTNLNFKVRASYMQIYNELVSDLLKPPTPAKQLVIRQSKNRVYVDGLSEWVVKSPSDIFGLMERGCTVRATASHRMSELSSRSHAIFQIVVEILEGDYDAPQSFKVGKLNIVDLAGSEKVRSTGVTGQRLEEAKKINWSLHQLGNVISALTDPNRRDPHIPYRNSKLTHLLTDSLGGNCKTTLIACISPAFESYNESLSTLKFANRAKNIKNDAVVNEDADQRALIAKYEKELKRLRIFIADQQEKGNFGPDPERRLRAEADRDMALEALEARDRYLDEEKRTKQRLEGRIDELERQLLSNGVVDSADSQKEDMAQVERYKQLLLKQRDIMLNLTQRLNERDETILRLQEEIDAYDAHVQELEDQLEGKGDARSPLLAPKTKAEAERHVAKCKVFVRGEPRYQSENGGDRLLSAEEKIAELISLGAGSSPSSHFTPAGGQYSSSPSSALTLVHGAHTDPETKRALEVALKKHAEEFAATIVRERCNELLDEVSALRARLAEAQQELRAAGLSEEISASGRSMNQSADRIREHVAQETQAIRETFARKIEHLESLLAAERNDAKKLSSELQRVAFQVGRMRDTLEPSRARELDGLWDAIVKMEASVGREVAAAVTKLATPSQRRVDPNNSSSLGASNNNTAQGGHAIRVMQLESAVDTLKRQQVATRQEMQAQIDERTAKVRDLEAELVRREQQTTAIKKSLHTHEKDRAALKKILEQRIKVKLDTIATALRSGHDVRKVDPDLSSLQNLINASINAMNADQTA